MQIKEKNEEKKQNQHKAIKKKIETAAIVSILYLFLTFFIRVIFIFRDMRII
jgi:hypothetical protein